MAKRSVTFLTGYTLKTVVRDFSTGTEMLWNTSGGAFEAYSSGHIASYGITATEGSPGEYAWTVPALSASAAGFSYEATTYQISGSNLATTDLNTSVWADSFRWDGTFASIGAVDLQSVLNTAVTKDSNNVLNVSTKYVNGTLQTARDLGANPGPILLSSTGITTPATADTYIPVGALNGQWTYVGISTGRIIWYAGGSWVNSVLVNVVGAASFSINGAIPIGTYTSGGTATGSPVVAAMGTSTLGGTAQTGDSFAYLGTNLGALGANATALAPASTALSTVNWTTARAGKLDNLDATTSSRMATYTQPTGFLATTFAGTVGTSTFAIGQNVGTATSVTGAVASVTGAVGSVTGAVGSVTAGVTVTTNNDKTGYALAASQHVIVDSGTVTTLTNLPSIPANWITAAGIAASALNGKGDWSTAGAKMDLIDAPNATAVTAIQSGLSKPGTAQTITPPGTMATLANQTSMISALAMLTGRPDTSANVTAMKVVTDMLATMIVANAFTTNALKNGPSGSGGGGGAVTVFYATAAAAFGLPPQQTGVNGIIIGCTLNAGFNVSTGSISDVDKLYVTCKQLLGNPDSAALFQIEMTGGLLVLNGNAAPDSTQGSLSYANVDGGGINIEFTLSAAATSQLLPTDNNRNNKIPIDVKLIQNSGEEIIIAQSTVTISRTPTAAIQ